MPPQSSKEPTEAEIPSNPEAQLFKWLQSPWIPKVLFVVATDLLRHFCQRSLSAIQHVAKIPSNSLWESNLDDRIGCTLLCWDWERLL